MDQYMGANHIFNLPTALRLKGDLDVPALERSLASLMARHEALRTTFVGRDGQPVQQIHAQMAPWFETLQVPDSLNLKEAVEQAKGLLSDQARRPFDLSRGPLLRGTLVRISPGDHLFLINLHHIIADAWSVGLLCDELSGLYAAYSKGKPSPLAELQVQYADYSEWQRDWLAGDKAAASLAYWKQNLDGLPAPMIPSTRSFTRKAEQKAGRESALFPLDLTRQLKELSRRQGCTLFMTLAAGFCVVLARHTATTDFAIGTPVANRNLDEVKGLIGFFVNMLVLRVDLSGEPTFREFLKRIRSTLSSAYEHQELPFEQIVEALSPAREIDQDPFFQVVFDMHTVGISGGSFGDLTAEGLELATDSAEYGLVVTVVESPKEGLHCRIEYSTDLFEAGQVQRLLGHFRMVLEGATRNAEQSVWTMPLLTAPESEQLTAWGGEIRDPAETGTLGELFTAVAQNSPHAVALEQGKLQWTYAKLNERANQIANRLQELGVGPDTPVGLCLERSPEMVAGLLGIVKAGAAYVPLDPEYPQDRLQYLLTSTGASIVVTRSGLEGLFPGRTLLVTSALAGAPAHEPRCQATEHHLAYILFTSGSTGKPKGVGVEHHSVIQLVRSVEYVELGPQHTLLQYAPLAFDASTFEIWGALLHGSRLVIQPAGPASLEALGETIRLHGVSMLWLTTGLFSQMVEERLADLRGVQQLITGGEVINPEIVRRALEHLPHTRLFNAYGPTEATTFSTIHQLYPERVEGSVPIGRPLDHTQVYLLDKAGQPVPVGVEGEMHIGGEGVARGYTGQPALTAQYFVPDAVSGERGRRLYRTGDWGRYRADGVIEFCGRRDHQVKLRGFRIELGEVEAALVQHPDVRSAAVVVQGTGDHKGLAAYVVPSTAGRMEVEALRGFMASRLPGHMLPSAYVTLDRLPLTANGKLDRAALPQPEWKQADAAREPGTATEKAIARIWGEVLERGPLSAVDHFFDLGGHSLLATRAVVRMKAEFSVEIALRELFEMPTIEAFAQRIDELRTQRMAALARQVQAMSPEMKEQMLARARAAAGARSAGALAEAAR